MTQTDMPNLRVPVIEFAPARLLHVTPPKTGSTSLLQAYMQMAGLAGPDEAVRAAYRTSFDAGRATEAGLVLHKVKLDDLGALVAQRDGWTVICTIRSPYDRAVSNWFSKLNRYAKHFDPPSYRYGKLRQLLEGPRSWPHIERANAHMQRRIPFRAMLEGLAAHGVGFDNHFEQQSRLLMLDKVRYGRVIRLEEMGTEFPRALSELGVPQALTARLATLPHRNKTASQRTSALLDAAAVALIRRIYAADCLSLGYPSPLARQAVDDV